MTHVTAFIWHAFTYLTPCWFQFTVIHRLAIGHKISLLCGFGCATRAKRSVHFPEAMVKWLEFLEIQQNDGTGLKGEKYHALGPLRTGPGIKMPPKS